MTKLSVNINKVATIRNSRGGNIPNIIQVAVDCQLFGADGITVHPRPDERHIRYSDVYDLQAKVSTEFNIEGNPTPEFISLISKIRPTQVTLVPDEPTALTSNIGWNTIAHQDFLTEIVSEFQSIGVRTSLFVNPDIEMIKAASKIGTAFARGGCPVFFTASACRKTSKRGRNLPPKRPRWRSKRCRPRQVCAPLPRP